MSAPWIAPPELTPTPEPTTDPDALALAQMLGVFITMGASLDERSAQVSIGSSEVGWSCDRRVAYRLHGVARTNPISDPLRSLIGTGVHLALARTFSTLDPRQHWFRVEDKVTYRGVPGTADLVYLIGKTVVDWKTAKKSKIARIRREGIPRHYRVQAHLYAAGLRAAGHDINHVAIAYVPLDLEASEGVDQLYVVREPFDQTIADDAVDRIERLRQVGPEQAQATPDRLCPWCSHYRPDSTDLETGCPGQSKEKS